MGSGCLDFCTISMLLKLKVIRKFQVIWECLLKLLKVCVKVYMTFKISVDNFFTLVPLFDALKKVQCILQELVELRY